MRERVWSLALLYPTASTAAPLTRHRGTLNLRLTSAIRQLFLLRRGAGERMLPGSSLFGLWCLHRRPRGLRFPKRPGRAVRGRCQTDTPDGRGLVPRMIKERVRSPADCRSITPAVLDPRTSAIHPHSSPHALFPSACNPDVPVASSVLVAGQQRLKPRMTAQRVPNRIEAKQRNGNNRRNRQQLLESIDGCIVVPRRHVDPGQCGTGV